MDEAMILENCVNEFEFEIKYLNIKRYTRIILNQNHLHFRMRI